MRAQTQPGRKLNIVKIKWAPCWDPNKPGYRTMPRNLPRSCLSTNSKECCEKHVVSRLKRGSECWEAVEGRGDEGEVRVRSSDKSPFTTSHSHLLLLPRRSPNPQSVWKLLQLKFLRKELRFSHPHGKHFCFQCCVTWSTIEIVQLKKVRLSHKGLNETRLTGQSHDTSHDAQGY